MYLRYYSQFDGQPFVARIRGDHVRIGGAQNNDIVLHGPFIDSHAVELCRQADAWIITAIGLNGCDVGEQRLHARQSCVWDGFSQLRLFPFIFQLQELEVATPEIARRYTNEIHDLIKIVHLDMLQQMHLGGSAAEVPSTTESLLQIERAIESSAMHHRLSLELRRELAGCCVRDEILHQLLDRDPNKSPVLLKHNSHWNELATAVPDREENLRRLAKSCTAQLFQNLPDDRLEHQIDQVDTGFWKVWDQWSPSLPNVHAEYLALRQVKKQVKDILFGFGPLEDLLRMPTISEIMVNRSDQIFVEKAGVLQQSGRQFVSDEVTLTVIERIVSRVGRRIDTAQPMVDARLPDGSRVNAIIPPLAVKGPCLTIRKFARRAITMPILLEKGSITPQVTEFLQGCVRARRSILISGGTGSGKTTLLNCLSQSIPTRERIICIEDTHELQLDHPHTVFVECRDGNNEGKGKIAIKDLLKNALRQRPDRLIIGECRGDEALEMLQAMNTGHDGSMTTIHANNPADALRRLEVLVRDSGLPLDAIRQQVVSAIDIAVQLTRLPDGRRCITEVIEVVGYDEQQQTIRMRKLFEMSQRDATSESQLQPTGHLPSFASELIRDGHVRLDVFLTGVNT